jgi:hypothetical protein
VYIYSSSIQHTFSLIGFSFLFQLPVEFVVGGVDNEFEGSGDEKSKISTTSESPVLLNPPPKKILF